MHYSRSVDCSVEEADTDPEIWSLSTTERRTLRDHWLAGRATAVELCASMGSFYQDAPHTIGIGRWLTQAEPYLKLLHKLCCESGVCIDAPRGLSSHWRAVLQVRAHGMPFASMRRSLEWSLQRRIGDGVLQTYLRRTDTADFDEAWEQHARRFFVPKAYDAIPIARKVGDTHVAPLTRWISLSSWSFCQCGRSAPAICL